MSRFVSRPEPISLLKLIFTQLGFVLLIYLHFARLSEYPGLHYDEAWAMNFASGIGAAWPLRAMSPYTAPWAHYWASLLFHTLGPSVLVYRASQVALSLLGMIALHFSLPRASRFLFPWAALLLPGLLLNHRFAVELTGFHALAFGLLCFGLSRRWWALTAFAAFAGSTAHILFYGVVLGLSFSVLLRQKVLSPGARAFSAAYFTLISIFFVRVLLEVPEKGKGLALLASALAGLVFTLAGAERWRIWSFPWLGRAVGVAALPFLFNALVFGQGYWTSSIYTGLDVWSLYPGLAPANFLAGLAVLLLTTLGTLLYLPAFALHWLLASSVALGAMMLKPAPRYYELILLGLAAAPVLALAPWAQRLRWPAWRQLRSRSFLLQVGVASALLLTAYTNLEMNETLFEVRELVGGVRETNPSFLFFKDSSRDFLDKQGLVRFLGGSGCRPSDIESHDPRLVEELKALSLGDWKADSGACPFDYVALRSEEGASGKLFGAFLLRERAREKMER